MSSVKQRPDGQWRARYRDRDGKEHARHFKTKKAGQKWIDDETTALVTGIWVDPRAGRVLLRDYASHWQAVQVGRSSTLTGIDVALRLHTLPALGHRPMVTILRTDIQGFVKSMEKKGIGAGHIRNIYDVTRRLFVDAVDDGIISAARQPCRRITLPPADGKDLILPTVDQVAGLAESVANRYRAAVVLLAGSGLRIGELLGLRVSAVDFLRRVVHVRIQREQDGTLSTPKSERSIRSIPVGQVVIDELAAHIAEFGDGSEWMFTTQHGRPLSYSTWDSLWSAAQRVNFQERRQQVCPFCRADVGERCRTAKGTTANVDHTQRDDVARGAPNVDTHDLRHFFASCLIAGGTSVTQVSKLLGHSSPAITLKVYAHLWPGDDDRARAVVDGTLGGLRTGRGLAG